MRALLLAAAVLCAGCAPLAVVSEPDPLLWCEIGAGGTRARLTPEQSAYCIRRNAGSPGAMFSPLGWGRPTDVWISVRPTTR